MRAKKKILLLFMAVVLLTGCGRGKTEHSGKAGSILSAEIKICGFGENLVENIDIRKMSGVCINADIQTGDTDSQYRPQIDESVLRNLFAGVEEEKKKAYTITCIDRLYYELQENLSPEDWKTFQTYLPVLRGETTFYYVSAMDHESRIKKTAEDGSFSISFPYMEEMTINDYAEFLEQMWYSHDWIRCVSLTDLDGNGEKELIIRTVYDNRTLVLHRENNKIYWIDFWYRMFEDLQENGIHMGSGGAGSQSYSQLIFQDGMFIWKNLAKRENLQHYIGGREISETEFEEWIAVHMNQDARWYEMDAEKDEISSSYDQLAVFAENYKEWMESKGDNYDYCIYDFDQDGRLELLVTVKNEYGVKNYFYQVEGEDIKELAQDYYGIRGKEFDICSGMIGAYCDKSTGIIYYRSRSREDYSGSESYGYFYMAEGKVHHVPVSVVKNEEGGIEHYFDVNKTGNEEIDGDTFQELNSEIEEGKVKVPADLEFVEGENESSLVNYDYVLSNLIASYQGGDY